METRSLSRGRPEAVVHVDDEGDALENFLELRRRRPPRFGIRPIDLGKQRRKHGRPRRNFDNLQRRALGHVEAAKLFADFERDFMARARALRFRREIELQIALLRPFPQIIVPDEAVEIEGRRRAGIRLDGDKLRHVFQPLRR